MRILLVEEGWNSTLYVARALEEAGHAVTVVTANGATGSRRRRSVQWRAAPTLSSPGFTTELRRVIAADRIELVVPLTEGAMWRLWDAPCRAAVFPDTEDWQRRLLRNKHRLVEHMAARGVDVPRQEPLGASPPRILPVVLKAATSVAGSGVVVVDTPASYARAIRRALERGGDWVLQEHIAGPTYLFGGLFHAGRPLRIYAAEKLEQHPPRTGPAIRVRSDGHPALIAAGLRVFAELRWTGFASADFLRRADGRHALVEVNPRLWGSVAAAIAAGVDLFGPFAELLAGRVPSPDLTFARDEECTIFPRYLLSRKYQTVGGLARAVRDLLGRQGDEWRHPRFALDNLRRILGAPGAGG